MHGPSGRRFSWAISGAAEFDQYESALAVYQNVASGDLVAPSRGLADKLRRLVDLARATEDQSIAIALGDVLAGLQRRVQAAGLDLYGTSPVAAAPFANDR